MELFYDYINIFPPKINFNKPVNCFSQNSKTNILSLLAKLIYSLSVLFFFLIFHVLYELNDAIEKLRGF